MDWRKRIRENKEGLLVVILIQSRETSQKHWNITITVIINKIPLVWIESARLDVNKNSEIRGPFGCSGEIIIIIMIPLDSWWFSGDLTQ